MSASLALGTTWLSLDAPQFTERFGSPLCITMLHVQAAASLRWRAETLCAPQDCAIDTDESQQLRVRPSIRNKRSTEPYCMNVTQVKAMNEVSGSVVRSEVRHA
jgi:hypothetical protein